MSDETKSTREVLTVDEVAARLKVSRQTILRMIRDGRLAAGRVGRQWRIWSEAADALVPRQSDGLAQEPARKSPRPRRPQRRRK